jgi:allantoin racemase
VSVEISVARRRRPFAVSLAATGMLAAGLTPGRVWQTYRGVGPVRAAVWTEGWHELVARVPNSYHRCMTRILWLEPVGTTECHESIGDALRAEVASTTRVDVASLPMVGPNHLEFNAYEMMVAPGIAGVVRWAQREGYDGIVIGCFYDPGLRGAREIAGSMVVTAPAEACLHIASTLGERIAILVGREKWIPEMEENVHRYGFERRMHGFRVLGMSVDEFQQDAEFTERRIMEEARAAVAEGADCVILGCTMEFGFYQKVQAEIGVPVIDAAVAPVLYAEFLADLRARQGWSHSKRLGYDTPPAAELDAWVPIVEPILTVDPRP